MKVTANIATQPSREHQLEQMLKSIEGKFDEVRIFHNTKYENLTDNGKFYALDQIKEPEIFCTLDDDILYPPEYRDILERSVNHYGAIVTFHGRILKEPVRSYYRGHEVFDFRGGLDEPTRVDVGGTGVMAFDTRYFHPKGIAQNPIQRMSDLLFSLEATKQGKDIICLPKEHGWLKQIPVTDGIVNDRFADQSQQIKLAKEIIEQKR